MDQVFWGFDLKSESSWGEGINSIRNVAEWLNVCKVVKLACGIHSRPGACQRPPVKPEYLEWGEVGVFRLKGRSFGIAPGLAFRAGCSCVVLAGEARNDGGGAEFMHLRFNFICLQRWRVGSLHIDLV